MIDYINIAISLASIFIFLGLIYIVMIQKKNNGIIDICWSLNFILAALVSLIYTLIRYQSLYPAQIVIIALLFIWGLRLSIHIGKRALGKPEDIRYKKRRDNWGNQFYIKTFFLINMLQALWAAVIVSPEIFAIAVYPETRPGWIVFDGTAAELVPLIIGSIIWINGFYFEVIGDRQLRNFIKNPENKGKAIESGLWRFTRHPNYFGEITMAWGLFVIVISLAISNPWIWLTIIGPIIYTLLIRFVTGVPEVEKHLINKPGYKEYMERTSPLIPWFPKNQKDNKTE